VSRPPFSISARAAGRLAKIERLLGTWSGARDYLALFPRLSTASASRDLASGLAARTLVSRGDRAQTEYRFT
jgi:hypothetical protein